MSSAISRKVWSQTAPFQVCASFGGVSVLGVDPAPHPRRLREQMGIVLQSTGIDPYLTVAETIDMYRGFYPHPRSLDEVITLVGLEEKRTAKVDKLSGGQKRRLDVG